MALLTDIKNLLQPLTHDENSPWHIREETYGGLVYRNFSKRPQNLRQVFENAAKEHKDVDFLVFGDTRYTYGEAWDMAQSIGCAMVRDYDVKEGTKVAIAGRNSSEWILALMATMSVGAVAVLINGWWVRRELEYALNDCGAEVVFADEERLNRIGDMRETAAIKCIGLNIDNPPADVKNVHDLIEQYKGQSLPELEIDAEAPAWMLYTSGTTGFPKGSLSSHRAIIAAVMCFEFTFEAAGFIDPAMGEKLKNPEFPPCMLLTVPLFHVTGACAILMTSIRAGRRIVLMHKWDAKNALELVEQEKVTMFTGVPTMSWEMANHPDFDKYDSSSLTAITGGGAPTPNEQVRYVDTKFEGRPGIGYGLTETNAATATNTGDLLIGKPRSLIPAILVDLEIRDESGKVLKENEVGEIWISAPILFDGYWNKPEATAEVLVDGWFNSGDLGYLDEDGFLYIEDRAKDMVLRGGENVYCAEVENALYEVEGVFEVAVFGLPDERLGESVAAAIVLKNGFSYTPQEIQAALVEKIAKFKIPSNVYFYEGQLVRGATGKIQKRDIRDEIIEKSG